MLWFIIIFILKEDLNMKLQNLSLCQFQGKYEDIFLLELCHLMCTYKKHDFELW
jgi:hypothetical protein